ncbi:hypothetical protein GmHk_19G054362 [Glycine max]|nr:hypothetical protein GmHk_19G054362 [Glycine max]
MGIQGTQDLGKNGFGRKPALFYFPQIWDYSFTAFLSTVDPASHLVFEDNSSVPLVPEENWYIEENSVTHH